jgi:hypothetical protein
VGLKSNNFNRYLMKLKKFQTMKEFFYFTSWSSYFSGVHLCAQFGAKKCWLWCHSGIWLHALTLWILKLLRVARVLKQFSN